MRTCKAAYDSDDTETHSSISRKSVARKLMMDTEPDPRKRRHALCVRLWLCVGCIWEYAWVNGLGCSLTSNCHIETQNHHSRRWFAFFPLTRCSVEGCTKRRRLGGRCVAHGGGRRCEVVLARCVGGIREVSRGIGGGTRGYTRGLTVSRGN